MIAFEPDRESLAEAQLLAIEQGISLEEIAVEAFSGYMAGVKAARLGDIGRAVILARRASSSRTRLA